MKKILIIDDDPADQFLNQMLLSEHFPEIEVLVAFDGEEALEILNNEADAPDLILLDINMPRMNGHEFLIKYSENNQKLTPVIVMLTSSDQGIDKEKSSTFNCVKEYLAKPLSVEKIGNLSTLFTK